MFIMLGKENCQQLASPSLQNNKKAKKTQPDTPVVSNNSAKRIRNLIANIKVSPSIATSKDNPAKVAHNIQKIKRQNTLPLREIKHLDELNNRIINDNQNAQDQKPKKSQQNHLRLSYSRHNPEDAYQPKYEIGISRYMMKPGYNSKNSSKNNKPSTQFTLNLTELEKFKGKATPKKLFTTEEPSTENISDEYHSVVDDDDTSINSVPTFSQPNTSRSRHYLHSEVEKNITTSSFHFEEGSFHLNPRRERRFTSENFRYTPIKCSMSELESALKPETEFE